jgi:hypothetical protein
MEQLRLQGEQIISIHVTNHDLKRNNILTPVEQNHDFKGKKL